MYRILDQHAEVRERRNQLRHPAYQRPELLATGPKQLWSWDITKLRGPVKGQFYYLYVILDVFSRYILGWLIAERESAELAEELIAETCRKQDITAAQLTIHADHGSPMIAKPVAQLLADLGVQKSHSRPHVSNDNPYSEAQFRTLKYCPTYPERFGSVADARQWGQEFFTWYNDEHHHTGLALLTPAEVHHGRAADHPDRTPGGAATGFRGASRTLRERATASPATAHRRVDQPAAASTRASQRSVTHSGRTTDGPVLN